MRLGFGFIGAGEIALATAKGVQTSMHPRLVRVMDTRADLAGDLVNSYGGSPAASVEELLADPLVEAVYLATPHYLHRPLAAEACHAYLRHPLPSGPLALRQATLRYS